jgi:hypothetical protein
VTCRLEGMIGTSFRQGIHVLFYELINRCTGIIAIRHGKLL